MINYIQKKYNEIWDSSKECILNNNITVDTNLLNIKSDKRLGLTLLIPITGKNLSKILKTIIFLQTIEPVQYYYPATDIHVTILDFIPCIENFTYNKTKIKIYKEILTKALKNFSRFNIKFRGLIASKESILIQGFPDKTLQELRKVLRNELKRRNIKLKERYKTITAHSTIIRFKQKLKNPKKLVEKIEKSRNLDFGKLQVNKIYFVLHDWYNTEQKTKILGKYNLK